MMPVGKYYSIALLMTAFAAVVCVALLSNLPGDTFWITDGGNKFIVMENIIRNGTDSLQYPAVDIDPEKSFFPDSFFHFNKRGEHVYSIFPSYFPWVSSWLFKAFGFPGLYILPLSSMLAVMMLCAVIIRQLKLPPLFLAALPMLAFATPFFFYSLTFWEMTPAVLCSTAAVAVLLSRPKGKFLLSGFLLGFGLFMREEMYFILVAILFALLLRRQNFKSSARKCGSIVVGFVLIMIPIWIFQYIQHGHVLGLHGSTYHSHNTMEISFNLFDFIVSKLNGYFIYLLKFNSGDFETRWYYYVLLLPLMLAVVAGIYFRRFDSGSLLKRIIFICSAVSFSILTVMLWKNPQPVLNTIFTVGLITSSPLLLPMFINLRALLRSKRKAIGFLTLISVLYILMLCPILTQTDMGVIWGPRHFMFIFPWLVPLSIYSVLKMEQGRFFRIMFIVLVVLSLAIQIKGVNNLFLMKSNVKTMNQKIDSLSDDIIISDVFWLVPENPTLYFKHKFMQFKNAGELSSLLEALRSRKISKFTLIIARTGAYRSLKEQELKAILAKLKILRRPELIRLRGSEFLDIIVLNCMLK
jgi:hypothetical protein